MGALQNLSFGFRTLRNGGASVRLKGEGIRRMSSGSGALERNGC